MMISSLTWDPWPIELVPVEPVVEKVIEWYFVAVELGVFWRGEKEDWKDDEAKHSQDDQGGDEHPLPVAVAAAVGHQLLKDTTKERLLDTDIRNLTTYQVF